MNRDFDAILSAGECKKNFGCGTMTSCVCALAGEMVDEIESLRAHLAIAKKALEEIDDLPSVQQDEGPTIARAALKDLP